MTCYCGARSHSRRIGDGRRQDDGNWGRHGLGQLKRFEEPSDAACHVDKAGLAENDKLGSVY